MSYSIRTSVTKATYEELTALAAADGITLSELLMEAVENYIPARDAALLAYHRSRVATLEAKGQGGGA